MMHRVSHSPALTSPVSSLSTFFLFQNYTQYIPLSIYDLQTWMGSPSIFVYDCSNAGIIVKSFKQFALQREQELEVGSCTDKYVHGFMACNNTAVGLVVGLSSNTKRAGVHANKGK